MISASSLMALSALVPVTGLTVSVSRLMTVTSHNYSGQHVTRYSMKYEFSFRGLLESFYFYDFNARNITFF